MLAVKNDGQCQPRKKKDSVHIGASVCVRRYFLYEKSLVPIAATRISKVVLY